MSQVKTNNVTLAYCRETSPGVASTLWKLLEPNTINSFGSTISKVARSPISQTRQRKKGAISDLDSAVEFEADLTLDSARDFFEGFLFAKFTNLTRIWGPQETNDVTAVTATGYTVSAGGAIAQGLLIYARGFTNAANNGLKVVGAASTGTEIKTAGLTVEAGPPAAARVEVAGVQGATGDIQVNAGGELISTVLDFTTLGLTVGQMIWVGGDTAGTSFAVAANRGWARVTAIAANLLTIDKTTAAFSVDNGSGKTIQLFFGQFLRNLAVTDANYLERTFQFEGAYPDLDGVGTPAYEYAISNYCNQAAFNLPLTDKATVTLGFIGTDTEVPTITRKTGASSAIVPIQKDALSTTSDIARLRITKLDESGLTTYFKTVTATLLNNVSPEKVLARLGAAFMNTGVFQVDIEAQILFTNKEVVTVIRQNTTVAMDFSLRNNDGAIFVDIPSMTLNGGDKEYPVNETVLLNTTAEAFEDPTLGYSIGISIFPYVPSV